MQNTRLTTLINVLGGRFTAWLLNPWRRLSLGLISLLFGFFFATAIASIAGQTADLDVVISLFLLLFTEAVSRLVYRKPLSPGPTNQLPGQQSLVLNLLNTFKLGLTYGLFVEAFKLGS